MVHPHEYPLSFFKVVVIGLDLSVTDPCAFCFVVGAMVELYSFDDVVNAMQGGKTQKKHT